MSDQNPADQNPISLEAWIDRQQAPPEVFRTMRDLLVAAHSARRLHAELRALTPRAEGERLADIVARSGVWGMIEVVTPGERCWTVGVRLPLRGEFLLLQCVGNHANQLRPLDPEWKDPRAEQVWRSLKASADLRGDVTYTLDAQTDTERHGHAVFFTPLHTFPSSLVLAERDQVFNARDAELRKTSTARERRTQYLITGALVVLLVAMLIGLLLTGILGFALVAAVVSVLIFGVFTSLDPSGESLYYGDFWTPEEQQEFEALTTVRNGVNEHASAPPHVLPLDASPAEVLNAAPGAPQAAAEPLPAVTPLPRAF